MPAMSEPSGDHKLFTLLQMDGRINAVVWAIVLKMMRIHEKNQ